MIEYWAHSVNSERRVVYVAFLMPIRLTKLSAAPVVALLVVQASCSQKARTQPRND